MRPQNSVALAASAAADQRELRAARRLIAAYERILTGCTYKTFSGYQNGNGTEVGTAIDRARAAYKKVSQP